MPSLVGQTFCSRYRIEESLGQGGMAEVYKAWDTQRATYLALKVLREDLSRDLVFLRRFQREAHTLAKLQHPNIVRFYGIETDHLTVYILMDFIEGSTLQDEIFLSKGQPLAQDFMWLVLQSISSALHYAHSMRLVHCDIKPGNIMINQEGHVLLTDFGIARMTDTATSTMVGFGTPAYMAPELVRGQDPTPQSDIYSLGIVLYEMATGGERPFTGERAQITGPTSEKVRWEQVHLAPYMPRLYNPSIPTVLEGVILTCLTKDPAGRYGSALDLLNALELALSGDVNLQIRERKPEVPAPHQVGDVQENVGSGAGGVDDPPKKRIPAVIIKPNQKTNQRSTPWALWAGGVVFLLMGLFLGVSLLGGERASTLVATEHITQTAVVIAPTAQAPVAVENPSTPTSAEIQLPASTDTIASEPTSTPTPEPTLGIGSTMINPIDGAIMAFVPEGEFLMGSESADAWAHETPQHSVYLDSIWIYIYEVTNAQFQMFVQNTGYRTTAEQRGASYVYISDGWVEVDGTYWYAPTGPGSTLHDLDTHPVIHMSWFDAVAYCEWAGGRLPTEAEWEKAARGEDGRKYPWGDTSTVRGYANFCDRDCPFEIADVDWNDGYVFTAPVGSYPSGISPYGLLDMAGNVWEWVQDWYEADYYSRSPGNNPLGPTTGKLRVLRGGSWENGEGPLRTSFRYWYDPVYAFPKFGFRCAHTLSE